MAQAVKIPGDGEDARGLGRRDAINAPELARRVRGRRRGGGRRSRPHGGAVATAASSDWDLIARVADGAVAFRCSAAATASSRSRSSSGCATAASAACSSAAACCATRGSSRRRATSRAGRPPRDGHARGARPVPARLHRAAAERARATRPRLPARRARPAGGSRAGAPARGRERWVINKLRALEFVVHERARQRLAPARRDQRRRVDPAAARHHRGVLLRASFAASVDELRVARPVHCQAAHASIADQRLGVSHLSATSDCAASASSTIVSSASARAARELPPDPGASGCAQISLQRRHVVELDDRHELVGLRASPARTRAGRASIRVPTRNLRIDRHRRRSVLTACRAPRRSLRLAADPPSVNRMTCAITAPAPASAGRATCGRHGLLDAARSPRAGRRPIGGRTVAGAGAPPAPRSRRTRRVAVGPCRPPTGPLAPCPPRRRAVVQPRAAAWRRIRRSARPDRPLSPADAGPPLGGRPAPLAVGPRRLAVQTAAARCRSSTRRRPIRTLRPWSAGPTIAADRSAVAADRPPGPCRRRPVGRGPRARRSPLAAARSPVADPPGGRPPPRRRRWRRPVASAATRALRSVAGP